MKEQKMPCQLTLINELKRRNSWINNLLQIRVKILRRAKRRAIFLTNKILNTLIRTTKAETTMNLDNAPIDQGNMVRVRSKKEIRSMLDDYEKYKGCLFIDEMYEYCDGTYTVVKEINYFFDEAKQKLCKCKDTVILEGVTCSGRQRLYPCSCDRNCFFFWHKEWLKKISKY